jgi:trigger factor
MHTSIKHIDDTHVLLTISGEQDELKKIKEHVLLELAKSRGNVPGFRKGKAPLPLIEKQLPEELVQSEFIEHAVNDLYGKAVRKENLKVVGQPKVELKKYVPYTTVEFTAEAEVIGELKLADYKNLTVKKPEIKVTAKEVNEVLDRLALRDAEKTEVSRAAKDGDEVWIDFKGVDAKTKEAVAGADGKDYPLALGSGTFIPGFEPEIVGMKAGEEKTFSVTFPKDYGVKTLQLKKVSFTVTVNKVTEVKRPKLDDEFAAKVGPFKSIEELKGDVKKQITSDRTNAAEREYENELVMAVAKKTKVAIPKTVIEDQIDRMEQEEKNNLIYRGQTWEEHLKEEGVTAEAHRERNRGDAELRVKAGLILSEIAQEEKLEISQEEFDAYLNALKQQYRDEQMQAELMKPENQRDLVSRLLTQKAVDKIKEYNKG